MAGEKDLLGLWAGTGGEGAKFWMSVLTDIRNPAAARTALDELAEKWGDNYAAIIRCGRTPGRSSSLSWTTT